MNAYIWRGPLTSIADQVFVPGATVKANPADPIVQTWTALGYLEAVPIPNVQAEAAPVAVPSTKKKGGA